MYATAKASRLQTEEGKGGDGSGVDVLVNRPYEDEEMGKGQYTEKIYHLGSHVPGFLRKIMPKTALLMEEKAWNGYPHCKTVLSSPYFGEKVKFVIETMHLPGGPTEENALKLGADILDKREVVMVDIAMDDDQIDKKNYLEEEDPKLFLSEKTGRGRLSEGWVGSAEPLMTAYKQVTIEFNYWGLQGKVERWAQGFERKLFTRFHRQLFCWIDEWYGWDMEDVRAYEDQTARLLREEDISNDPPIPRPKPDPAEAKAAAAPDLGGSDDSDFGSCSESGSASGGGGSGGDGEVRKRRRKSKAKEGKGESSGRRTRRSRRDKGKEEVDLPSFEDPEPPAMTDSVVHIEKVSEAERGVRVSTGGKRKHKAKHRHRHRRRMTEKEAPALERVRASGTRGSGSDTSASAKSDASRHSRRKRTTQKQKQKQKEKEQPQRRRRKKNKVVDDVLTDDPNDDFFTAPGGDTAAGAGSVDSWFSSEA